MTQRKNVSKELLEYQNNDSKSGIIAFFVILSVLVLFFSGFAYGSYLERRYYKSFTIQDVCSECNNIYGLGDGYTADFINGINKINDNCGSVFITHKGTSKDWYVFVNEKKDGWTRSNYISVEECLKG